MTVADTITGTVSLRCERVNAEEKAKNEDEIARCMRGVFGLIFSVVRDICGGVLLSRRGQ